jgi:membrane associated rhomboid family serine protease
MTARGPGPELLLEMPGKVLRAVMIALFAIWLVFALAMNWAGVSSGPLSFLVADAGALTSGQLWRLATAPLIHAPNSVGHILGAELGLFFLAPSLESRWGSLRFARFLALTALLSYGLQALVLALMPAGLGAKFAGGAQFGAMPVVEAVAIAWACSFRGRTVNLFFVLPVSSRGLIWFVVGFSVLTLIAGQMPPSGHIALFSGMGFGWLLGGGTPSPLRRAYLRYKLGTLDREAEREAKSTRKKAERAGLRVISGGKDDPTQH